ncbi:Integrator complex subunit 6-A [Halotydeus destructor]|nr:Integrator complex subunit 6-A [Halotydeus destructor]
MTIILFLVDTSASMNQRTYLGARPTLLDVAKDAVEKFLKLRQRDPASRGDRYMLLTFEDTPGNIKAGWKEHHNVFMTELKNLTASGMTTLGPSLRNAFDLLNLNRMQTGIDTYGHGRCPYYFEPSIIIVITDGGRLSNTINVQEDLKFHLPPTSSVPGSELTLEACRWDQRLFALVLRLTGTLPLDHTSGSTAAVACDNSPIDTMCDGTGGRSYAVSSQRSLMQCLESIVSKIQGGVVIQFDKVGPDPLPVADEDQVKSEGAVIGAAGLALNGFVSNVMTNGYAKDSKYPAGWSSCRRLIYVHRNAQKGYSVGHWPLPEAFWPNLEAPSLPKRTAHPLIKFTCTNSDAMIIDNLPFDKYELEPSPLTQVILSRKQPQVAWQCFVAGSHHRGASDLGLPFGYLKASTTLNCVNLFVLPYNYPVLLPLLEDLFKVHHGKPTREWKMQFDAYLKNLPLYYASPLKRALQRMGASPSLVPDNMETCLSFPVINYLKRLKNSAKSEFEKLIVSVSTSKATVADTIRVTNSVNTKKLTDIDFNLPSNNSRFSGLRNELNEFSGFQIHIKDKITEAKSQCFRNAFDISRHELIDQIVRMRNNFLQAPGLIKFHDEDQVHSLPVSQMGNYQDYLKKMPIPLRELESGPVRQHMFGNPFKLDRSRGMLVDETDIDLVGNGNSAPVRSPRRQNAELSGPTSPGRSPRRRPGPLPRDFTLQRSRSPSPMLISPPPSPFSPSPTESTSDSFSNLPDYSTSTTNFTPIVKPEPVAANIDIEAPPLVKPVVFPEPAPPPEPINEKPPIVKMEDMTNGSMFGTNYNVHKEAQSSDHKRSSPPTLNGKLIVANEKLNVHQSSTNGPTKYENNNNSFHINSIVTASKRTRLTAREQETRRALFKLVRKPGKDYTELTETLSKLTSPFREYAIHEVKCEARRFKRDPMISHLNEQFGTQNGSLGGLMSSNENSLVPKVIKPQAAHFANNGKFC